MAGKLLTFKNINMKNKAILILAYVVPQMAKSTMTSVKVVEGETIEDKIARVVHGGEAIKDGSPEIYTERKDGVIAAYNIRTDRFEIACEAMDTISGSIDAKRDSKMKLGHEENIAAAAAGGQEAGQNIGDKPTEGKSSSSKTADTK